MNHPIRILIIILLIFEICCFLSCTKDLPVITTANVAGITQSTAVSGGNVTDNGGAEVTARGVCWSTTVNPSLGSSKTSDGEGNGAFQSNMTGLSANTTYYVCAYAANSEGTALGNVLSFTTNSIPLAILSTTAVSSIGTTTAISGGNITNDGGAAITARGVCWATTENPNISNNKTSNGTGTGSFSSNITGLQPGTTYYIRAYATNDGGTAYGNQVTLITYISDIDGNIYKTTAIGSQIWMKENLKTTRHKDGTIIPLVTGSTEWGGLTSPGYCWYNNSVATYGGTYGALYNWYTVSPGKLCPDGWHVPTDAEWTILVTFLGGPNLAGGKMKEQGTAHWISPNVGATNESNFTGLPGAYRDEGGGFYETVGHYGFWWSSTEISSTNAWDRGLRYETNEIRTGEGYKKVGMSIRCLKN